ncbi:MAG: IS110 family transposase, partial [Verrucomicrobia bacterium]
MNAPELVFVGIDVSKDTLELALDDHSPTRRMSNDVTGIAPLGEELLRLV